MDTFYEPLLELEAFGQIREQLKKEEGLQLITGCVDSQKTHLMYSLGRDWPVKLILTYNELKAKEIYEEYEALGRMCITILPGISCSFRQIFREMNCCASGYLQ
mgnify:CR=1 FL=1